MNTANDVTMGLSFSTLTSAGVSTEFSSVVSAWESAYHHYFAPVSREPIESKFAGLAATWKNERGPSSSFSEMVLQPSYQRIIGMGPNVLPSILNELANEPDHWFWALTAITGANPIPASAAGNLAKMREAWLHWAVDHGYCIE